MVLKDVRVASREEGRVLGRCIVLVGSPRHQSGNRLYNGDGPSCTTAAQPDDLVKLQSPI